MRQLQDKHVFAGQSGIQVALTTTSAYP